MRTTTKALVTVPAALGLAFFGASAASAASLHDHSANRTFHMKLADTMGNKSGSKAEATIWVKGDALTVDINGTGFTPNSPHAQHFHGSFTDNKNFTCPTSSADKDNDGQVTVEEGLPMYGDVILSLTTKGDTSPKSGLAVDRMPVADAQGNLHYKRTIQLSPGAGEKLRNLHIVQHGLDANGNHKYDMEALGESTFAKSLGVSGIPEEATNPATCGTVTGAAAGAMPTGGVETGNGSTQGPEALGAIGLGVAALAGAGGAMAYRRRVAATTR
ncbi:hypothetical protein SAMN05421678_11783 [Actinopolymorpha cephalotaxi]|uniref:CHRD domain-containing protein n=1 Tax=Actinopolymorpha cephalotaxi TaxID=504797 RepID=A0A1I2ZVH7_9ACTN|nr:hypothetical protein [Actinopolymorpha cephalotaxi]NYH84183.1 hypothetical protein [Actinopolymorpha cephalotaxi]SFH41616.1 hypothetical protein SAMN05421678_11783 [Actinopolymorpha cephalotaxi]